MFLFSVNDFMNIQSGVGFPIEKSSYFQLLLEERHHISKNRWYMSEKVGYDVGWDEANINWKMCHRSEWIAQLKASGRYPL